jgi:phosphoglycolate phosphatase-like HAD superfamily hydrolase
MRKLILFDVDGTLLWTDGAGRSAIRRALLQEMGATGPIDGYRFDGKTDPQIVRELMTAAGHPDASSASHIAAVCSRYVEFLRTELERRRASIRVFPGVHSLIDRIEASGDLLLGLLTCNLATGAALKLKAAGIDPGRFAVGAYGSDAPERSSLPPIAADRAATRMGKVPRGQDIVIIGDTPADIVCGASVAARAVGVATGHYTAAELRAAGAFAVFETLVDADAVIDVIRA